MHFTLVKCCTGGMHTPDLFDDVMRPVYFALSRLGYSVACRANEIDTFSTNILFGSCRNASINTNDFPANSIIYNFEQIAANALLATEAYVQHLARHTVWDYSRRNIAYMRDTLGMRDVVEAPVGYVPEMTRLRQGAQDIDVLFYGAVNSRRKRILEQLGAAGLHVHILNGVYGEERDALITRAKLIVNIHFYTPAILEMPRLGYLLANGKAVASEYGPETERYEGLEDAALFCDYDNLVSGVLTLLQKDAARKALGRSAFNAFSRISLESILQRIVGRRAYGPPAAVADYWGLTTQTSHDQTALASPPE